MTTYIDIDGDEETVVSLIYDTCMNGEYKKTKDPEIVPMSGLRVHIKGKHHAHEYITGACKLYFDVDHCYETQDEYDYDHDAYIVESYQALQDHLDANVLWKNADIKVASASGFSVTKKKWVASIRMIVNGAGY